MTAPNIAWSWGNCECHILNEAVCQLLNRTGQNEFEIVANFWCPTEAWKYAAKEGFTGFTDPELIRS